MELWQYILTFISASATTTIVLAYLVRLLLKSGLDKDLERYKNELAIQQFQFQKRFSLIHEKRAEVLGELYSRLDRLGRAFTALTNLLQLNDGRTIDEKKEMDTQSLGQDFSDYYSTKKIYLDESLCNQIEEIQKTLHDAWIALSISPGGASYQDNKTGLWKHSSIMVNEEFPRLKKQLEEQFRKELGSIEGQ